MKRGVRDPSPPITSIGFEFEPPKPKLVINGTKFAIKDRIGESPSALFGFKDQASGWELSIAKFEVLVALAALRVQRHGTGALRDPANFEREEVAAFLGMPNTKTLWGACW